MMTISSDATPGAAVDDAALRDWFAGQALVGMIPTPRAPGVLPMSVDQMAVAAYGYADAMMRARSGAPKTAK